MTSLIILRGLPASGKTTTARIWVQGDPLIRARLNRDDMRATLFNSTGILPREQEEAITKAQHAQAAALLKAGVSVVVDDTNLRLKYANAWATLADKHGANFTTVEIRTDVETCVVRDRARYEMGGRLVGEQVIRNLHARFPTRPTVLAQHRADTAVEPYVPNKTKPNAIIVDIDGTLALMTGRGPYDTHRYHEDIPNPAVFHLLDTYTDGRSFGYTILCSGRDETFRPQTEAWLDTHNVMYDRLLMRPAGDLRNDAIIKRELFDAHIRHEFDVKFVLDDRNRVVDMWRQLGLACLQVAPGDF